MNLTRTSSSDCRTFAAAGMQEELLRAHVAYCAARSPYYQALFKTHGIDPSAITLATLSAIPPTDKAAFAAENHSFLAVPESAIVDIVLSSGTTGAQTAVMYTDHDLHRLAYNEAKSFAACGITREDVALLTCTIDRCFIAGLAYQMGLRELGAAVIRNGASTCSSHQEILKKFQPTVIVGVPTFLRKLGEHLLAEGMDPAESSVCKLVCIGEPLRDAELQPLKLGRDLEEIWGADAYSTYASSETVSTFCDCTAKQGGHLHPELAVVEILDDAGNPVPPGTHGEVVLTPLQTEGMPLLRFKTGDVSFLDPTPCACGRETPRLGPILGRKSQMIKCKGTTLYPQSILAVLNEIPGVSDYYVEATSTDRLADEVTVHAAVIDHACSAETIAERLRARLRVKTHVVIEQEEAIARQVFGSASRKAVRFVDRRMKI